MLTLQDHLLLVYSPFSNTPMICEDMSHLCTCTTSHDIGTIILDYTGGTTDSCDYDHVAYDCVYNALYTRKISTSTVHTKNNNYSYFTCDGIIKMQREREREMVTHVELSHRLYISEYFRPGIYIGIQIILACPLLCRSLI